ncbi:MAG: hypothetical protein L3J50_12505 [Emcibacter sp.]|nr:hypothetical protein [Emcibacter sp.]
MDLLKDNGFVPQADAGPYELGAIINGLKGRIFAKIARPLERYDFMDLMRDNGQVPAPLMEDAQKSQGLLVQLNEWLGKLERHIEMPVEHHDFMDLLHDKGFVPEPSNDNGLKIRAA